MNRIWKPWFIYQPTRVVRRALVALLPPPPGYTPLRTSWGVQILADASRMIGRSILTTGVYDLAVSEALARLISPGDTVVDAGANIGYMTVLASLAAGPGGRILSFEPHPALFAVAQRNATAVRTRFNVARIEMCQVALGDRPGTADLYVPPEFGFNDGTARILQREVTGGRYVPVPMNTLDGAICSESVSVLKLDVEGFELQVLQGSSRALLERRIRHIVFEDHDIEGSEVARKLREMGYQILSLGWSLRALRIQPVDLGSLASKYEAPSFIATLEPGEVLARCKPTGWLVLSRRLIGSLNRA